MGLRSSKQLPTLRTVSLLVVRFISSTPTAAPPTSSPVSTAIHPTANKQGFVDGEPFEIDLTVDDGDVVDEPGLEVALEDYLLSQQTNSDVINVTLWAIGSLPPNGRRLVISEHFFNQSCWIRDVTDNETVAIVQIDCQSDVFSALSNETALNDALTR